MLQKSSRRPISAAIDRRRIVPSQIELGIVTRIAGVPCIVARLRDPGILRLVMQAVLDRAAESDDAVERQQGALVAELLGQMDAARTPLM